MPLCRLWFSASLAVFCLSSGFVIAEQSVGLPSLASVMARDAQLHDLSFVDGRRGWTVGDRGTILRTIDGGRRWERQNSPVECPLYAVAFVDDRHGWAVGGYFTPYTHASQAVVLRTDDGGQSWRQMPADTLPLLRRVQFFDQQHGMAAGAATAFAPGGVFETSDGGRSWRPLPAERPSHWTAAHFLAPGVGVLAGQRGDVATIARQQVRRTTALAGDRRGLRDIHLIGPTSGWMVGDGGLVLTTNDLGRSWRPAAGPLPAVAEWFDWHSVAVQGQQIWAAGSPGSAVLHSSDAGQTWRLQPTGVKAPLEAIEFADDRRGWAVGALGTILGTEDGGRTWNVQRRGGARSSVAVIMPSIETAPLDLIASLAAAEGYLTAVDVVFSPDDSRSQRTAALCLHEAAVACGGSLSQIGWRLRATAAQRNGSPEELLAELNRQTDDFALEELERQLVLRLRTMQPELVLLARTSQREATAAEALVEHAIRAAMAAAADPTRYIELADAGLSVHSTARLAVVAPADPRSSPRLSSGDFDSLLGTSPAQWVGSTRGLVATTYQTRPSAIGWRVLLDDQAGAARGRNPMAGIAVPRGGGARRPAASPPAGELAELQAIAQKRRHMQQLLRSRAGDEAWMSQAVNLTSGLDANSGAELLYQLADSYRRAGKLDLAADAFYLLARRYTEHPLTDSSLIWLLHYYASSETAHAQSATNPMGVDARSPLANVQSSSVATPPPDALAAPAAQGVLSSDERLERAAQLGKYFEQARPALFADPGVRFAIAATQRRRGFTKDAQKYVVVLAKQAVASDWRRCAEAERWLAGENDLPPTKPIVNCYLTNERPMLDGMLNEPLWNQAERITIGADNSPADGGAVIRLTRDEEFLYLAVECVRRNGAPAEDTSGPRPRDGDLTNHDRVTLCFDADRDYTTGLELSIDSRGWTNDRCWGDEHWNPKWFVASGGDDDRWTAEAAIPLAALTKEKFAAGRAWAVSIHRESPNAAPQSWTGVTDPASPDRFGLLLFP